MSAIPLTASGAERLQQELHRLKTVERPAIIEAIAEARAQGDLSENAEYDAARERQGFVEGRIQELEGTLSNAQIITPAELEVEGNIVFGATVEIEELNRANALATRSWVMSRPTSALTVFRSPAPWHEPLLDVLSAMLSRSKPLQVCANTKFWVLATFKAGE